MANKAINPAAINLNYNDRRIRGNILNFIKQKILLRAFTVRPLLWLLLLLWLVAGKLLPRPLVGREKSATKRLKVVLMV